MRGQLLRHRLCAVLGLLPYRAVEDDIVRGRRVSELRRRHTREHLSLPDIGEIVRAILELRVVMLRRNIAILLLDLAIKLQGAAPDGFQLVLLQRRIALCRFLLECVVGFVGVAVALEHPASEVGQCRIAASFRDHRRIRHLHRLKGVVRQIVHDGEISIKEGHFRLGGAKEKSGCVQRVGVEEGEDRLHLTLQCAVGSGVRQLRDRKEAVEFGPRTLTVFHLVVVAAVVDGKGHIRQRFVELLRRDPFSRVLTVIVVAVEYKTGGFDEVDIIAVAVFVLHGHIVVHHGSGKGVSVRDLHSVGVGAV